MANIFDEYGVEFSPDGKELIRCPKKLKGEYIIPDGVESVAVRAFEFCEDLTRIVIPRSVTHIQDDAFFSCSGLTSLEIPDSVTSIGRCAFAWCADVKSIVIPSSIKTISEGAFSSCFRLSNVIFGKGVTSIGVSAFEYCYDLVDIEIPGNITSIGEYAFGDCNHLTNVTLRHGVLRIEAKAFFRCYKLTSILIPNSVTHIAPSAFRSCELKAINLEKGNPYYSTYRGVLFSKDKSMLIAFPGGKSKKGKYTVPDFVTTIGDGAFGACQLYSISVGKNVSHIGHSAMGGWRLKEINVDAENSKYCSVEGVLFSKDRSVLIEYPCGKSKKGSFSIPSFITSIGDNAFSGCQFKNIIIGDNVKNIGRYAFAYCRSLVSVSTPNNITSIDDYAFYDCDELLSVEISNSVQYIGEGAFDCCQLSEVIIGSNVEKIGGGNFRSRDLMSIVCKAPTPPKCGKDVFHNVIKNKCKLFVPSESVELYKSAKIWRSFKNILPMETIG